MPGNAVTTFVRLRRAAAAARDQRQQGYLAAVEAAAVGGDNEHIHLRLEDLRAIDARFPRQRRQTQPQRKRVAVGDAVERVLSAVGITPALVQRLTRTKNCGCKSRQKWLNQWGYRQQERMERLLNQAARWYGIS